MCPGCKAKQPRADNSQTPVKGIEICPSPPADAGIQVVERSMAEQKEVCVLETASTPSSSATCVEETVEVSLAMEIRCLRGEVSALRHEVREFRAELMGRVDALEDRVAIVENKYEQSVSPRLTELETTVGDLKLQLNERDQETLLNDVQVSGVTETKGENPSQLLSILAVKLGVQLDERDVVFVRRVGNVLRNRTEEEGATAARPRVIVARFARRVTRDSILSAARVRRNLCTQDIQVPGESRRIYINERLTKTNRQLFSLTRQAAARYGWKYAWTRDGRILARKNEGEPVVQLKVEADVDRFFTQK
ncbi:uncharacterized protein LOC124630606 [Helicoverpa zea]|uniref:uncharacterized protein LOC124630606 n=1 Tax=Helicoverpa zea TaxID=7113 RepID=UPI001F5AF79A|nr:uncharacterized protein LOC124630606 [Helicoverpa zea]